jgi:hypothetical protein
MLLKVAQSQAMPVAISWPVLGQRVITIHSVTAVPQTSVSRGRHTIGLPTRPLSTYADIHTEDSRMNMLVPGVLFPMSSKAREEILKVEKAAARRHSPVCVLRGNTAQPKT